MLTAALSFWISLYISSGRRYQLEGKTIFIIYFSRFFFSVSWFLKTLNWDDHMYVTTIHVMSVSQHGTVDARSFWVDSWCTNQHGISTGFCGNDGEFGPLDTYEGGNYRYSFFTCKLYPSIGVEGRSVAFTSRHYYISRTYVEFHGEHSEHRTPDPFERVNYGQSFGTCKLYPRYSPWWQSWWWYGWQLLVLEFGWLSLDQVNMSYLVLCYHNICLFQSWKYIIFVTDIRAINQVRLC